VILLHGGGNLGDFWGDHQRFREQVIRDFPGRRIIQLPQTIYFMDAWGVGEARRVFDAHKDFTLLCRDDESLRFAAAEFGGPCRRCPDMAFVLGPLRRPTPPQSDVVWLARTDAESCGTGAGVECDRVERTDWLEEPSTPLRERSLSLSGQIESQPRDWPPVLDALLQTYDPLARERLERGCRILSRGRVVITDRLHGHILCLLLNPARPPRQ